MLNRFLSVLKYILFFVTSILIIIFSIKNNINTKIILLYISFIILLIINIRDIKYKRQNSSKYNFLYCISMLVTIFLLLRSMLDKNLISNNKYYMDLLERMTTDSNLIFNYKEISLEYLSQNIYFLLIIYICLILYKLISNKYNKNYKYSTESIICLFINVVLSIQSINLLVEKFNIKQFPLLFFVVNIILLIVEISSLVKNNKRKKEWIIYLSFLFNLFAFIAIFT